jgi:acyl-CoA synthetase (AMP-forming)/AMP-acid ligase II
MLPSGRPYFEAFMGTLMASGVAVPLYPPTRIHRLEEHVRRQARIMANAQASLLVTFEEVKKIGGLWKSRCSRARRHCDTRRTGTASPVARGCKRAPATWHSCNTLPGSTGDPKGSCLPTRTSSQTSAR